MRSLTLLPPSLLALISLASAREPTTLPSGLKIEYTTPATCSRPSQAGDTISVHYRGTLLSTGDLFDESYKRGQPFTFTLGAHQVIEGWDQGLLDMCPGEGRKLTIPPELAYGDRNMGIIKAGSTLVFETELMDIVGVKQETVSFEPTSTGVVAVATGSEEGGFSIATAPATPLSETEDDKAEDENGGLEATPLDPETEDRIKAEEEKQAECQLLGPFALIVQAALGGVAVLSLVWKRYRETPKRPWKIWFFDVSKQVLGSMFTHILNLAMSMLGSVDVVNAAATAAAASGKDDPDGRTPNPCSFYLLNLGIDTTIGIPVLYILLKILHSAFLLTPLARPVDSIKSGHYGQPARTTWWLKQLLIYIIGLTGMKLFVFFLFAALPWLPWVGDWALRWTEGNEALEVTFVMFIFPLCMNAIQYWIIDSFIMEKGTKDSKKGYEAVQGDEEDGLDGDDEHGSVTEIGEEEAAVAGKKMVEEEPLKEVNPTPIDVGKGEGSRKTSPGKNVERDVEDGRR